jgi:hypothetical protein
MSRTVTTESRVSAITAAFLNHVNCLKSMALGQNLAPVRRRILPLPASA